MKEETNNRNKKEMILVTVGAIIILMLTMFLCYKSIKSKEEYVMHYSDSSELDYNVYLKKNDFYTTPYLPKDRVYISTLIDYIDASFNYNFDVVEDINLGYKYYISAKVVVDSSSGKRIYESEDMLLDKTRLQRVKDKKFSIKENVKIDYNKYNQLASSFIDKYELSARANVIVSMYVDVAGTYEKFEKELNDSAVVSFEIPLTANTTELKMNYDLKNNVNEKFEYGKTRIVHPFLFVLSVLIAIIDIIWFIYELVIYIQNKDVKVKYKEKLKKIFRDYGPYISKKAASTNTRDIMYTMSLRIEIVSSFDDLINVRDSIEKPILFYEAIPGEQAVFYIIDTKVSYIYIMNARDCGRKKHEEIEYTQEEEKEVENISNTEDLDDCEEQEVKEVIEKEDITEKIKEDNKEEIKEDNKEETQEELSTIGEEEVVDKDKKKKKKKKSTKKKKEVTE